MKQIKYYDVRSYYVYLPTHSWRVAVDAHAQYRLQLYTLPRA